MTELPQLTAQAPAPPATPSTPSTSSTPSAPRNYALDGLVDALDGVINGGACVIGDVVISVAGIELIEINLRALIAAASDPGSR